MDRKWRAKEGQAALASLTSLQEFVGNLPAFEGEPALANSTEAYLVYSQLHALGRPAVPYVCHSNRCWYFVAASSANPTGSNQDATEIVVPISTDCQELSPQRLRKLFMIGEHQVNHILLALADSDGTVTLSRLHNYVQAPAEGPGNLQQAQGSMGSGV